MNGQRETRWWDQLLVAGLAAALGLAALAVFLRVAEPRERTPRLPFVQDYSEKPLLDALAQNGFETRLAEIAAAGAPGTNRQTGRLSGSPGFYRTEQLISQAFRDAGLEVQTQELEVVVPHTEFCEVLDESGHALPGVTLYPFVPYGLVPLALPKEGIHGRLVQTESAELKYLTGHKPEDTIVLTYLETAAGWKSLASVGVRGLIVQEDELARKLQADPNLAGPWDTGVVNADVPFPVFVARGPIEKFADRQLTIRCKVTWESKPVRNILGVLRGDQPKEEALVLTAYYDSNSVVPELAPGAEQSVSLAALLEYAKALAPYRGRLPRDVVFVATAGHGQSLAGVCRLMEAIEEFSAERVGHRSFEQRRQDEQRQLGYVRLAQKTVSDLEALDPKHLEEFGRRWEGVDPGYRQWFEENFKVSAGEVDLECKEELLAKRLDYLRAGAPVFRKDFDYVHATDEQRKSSDNSHPLLLAFLKANRLEARAANLMALSFWELPARPEFVTWKYVPRFRQRLEQLLAHHQHQIQQLDDLIAVKKLFAPYQRTLTLNLKLDSGGVKNRTTLAVLVGISQIGITVEPQVTDLTKAIADKVPQANGEPAFEVWNWGSRDSFGSWEHANINKINDWFTELESAVWFRCGRLAFTVANADFYPAKLCTPEDTLDSLPREALQTQLPVLGRTILSMAYGRVPFKAIAYDKQATVFALHGGVFGSAGVTTMVASHPMSENTFVQLYTRTYSGSGRFLSPAFGRGARLFPILPVDPYGQYEKAINIDFNRFNMIVAQAARFDADGQLKYFKDASTTGQGVYKNEAFPSPDALATGQSEPKPINLALFRCAPVTLYDLSDPQTMKSFARVQYLNRLGLSEPSKFNNGEDTTFLEPDFVCYVELLAGSAQNEQIQDVRAFMLNADPAEPIQPGEPEIYGRGYLLADNPVLVFPQIDASASMLRTATKRLDLLKRYGMADEQMLGFQTNAVEWLETAREKRAQNDAVSGVNAAATSLAYDINNHPVIRSRISHAVVGILWYLGLLVPFVFFTEKLLFGFPDIRKQLLAVGLIFLVAFALLRLFHPAFQMVRSSLMILLGFVTLLLTLLVTLMVGGKFRQNIKNLRGKEGRVEGADINRGGVIGTAFMLGLNNMRRRKVRTGLTCVTLVLITFAMICFTSVSTDLVNIEYPTGRTPANGIMLRNQNYVPLQGSEVDGIRRIYADRYPILVRQWLVGSLSEFGVQNPEVIIDREYEIDGTKFVKRAKVNSALPMTWNEPLFTGLDKLLLTKRGWFPRPPETRRERLLAAEQGYKEKNYVILPETAAKELGISLDDVNAGGVKVNLRGEDYEVLGIIDPLELTKAIGLDGQPILPYDANAIQALGNTEGKGYLVPEDAGRMSGAQVILVNKAIASKSGEQLLTVSCSMLFPKEPYQLERGGTTLPAVEYREQRRLVLEFLERLGEPAYYGIDGIAYFGSRLRAKTIAGLLELLVPVLIAALTVFNTMRGSVYERKDEIYVYNAVGIAPNHVFFMFMAEACVYAVMGAMFGYLLSQGTGRALTALGWTGGLNMDYSSVETIYASLAIMAAVLLSTLLPARDAAKLASPSERTGWDLPVAVGDRMDFNLPFTFTPHDRVAVISYFHRWLDSNGAGSSGPFYCAPPELELKESNAATGDGELVPAIGSTVWLKPYDLGVSQRMEIALDTDPETGEYIAHITLERLSGHVAAWQRTVKPFLSALRKQFLNWRATTDADRGEMFGEAKSLLRARAARETGHA